MSYKVTENFLKKFGLNTLEDLPELPKYKVDENRQVVIEDILEENSQNESAEESIENMQNENKEETSEDKEEV